MPVRLRRKISLDDVREARPVAEEAIDTPRLLSAVPRPGWVTRRRATCNATSGKGPCMPIAYERIGPAPVSATATQHMVPTRDTVELATDVNLPASPGRHPAVLFRLPHDKNSRYARRRIRVPARRSGRSSVRRMPGRPKLQATRTRRSRPRIRVRRARSRPATELAAHVLDDRGATVRGEFRGDLLHVRRPCGLGIASVRVPA